MIKLLASHLPASCRIGDLDVAKPLPLPPPPAGNLEQGVVVAHGSKRRKTMVSDCIALADDLALAVPESESPAQGRGKERRNNSTNSFDSDLDIVFFRVTHTGLGRHKFKMHTKGVLNASDLAIQLIPVSKIYRDSKGDIQNVLLDLNVERFPETKVATWLNSQTVCFDDIAKNMKQWAVQNKEFWNFEAVDLSNKIQGNAVNQVAVAQQMTQCKLMFQECAAAKAYGGSSHGYVPDMDNALHLWCLQTLCSCGLFELCGNSTYTYRPLVLSVV